MSQLDEVAVPCRWTRAGTDFRCAARSKRLAFESLPAAMLATLEANIAYLEDAASKSHRKPLQRSTATGLRGDERSNDLPDLIDIVKQLRSTKKPKTSSSCPRKGAPSLRTLSSRNRTIENPDALDRRLDRRSRQSKPGFASRESKDTADGGWILIDLGTVVAHVFTPGIASVLQSRATLGRDGVAPSAGFVKSRPRPRRGAPNFEFVKKAGIWIFLVCFVASVVGVALVAVSR